MLRIRVDSCDSWAVARLTARRGIDYDRLRHMARVDTADDIRNAPDPGRAIAEKSPQGVEGTSSGVNIAPGSDDDGWCVPKPVFLSDGTRLQLYKDGEALHAAYEAIKGAKRRICLEVYIWGNDDTGRAFADLMCDKAQEGVRCYVI